MTPLIAVAVLLLVFAITLSVVQRRRQRDFSTPSRTQATSTSAASPAVGTDPASDPDWPFRDDPVFGTLTFDGEGTWTCDSALGEHFVEGHLRAGREGPGERHREWARAAQARGDELIREAGVRIVQLARRGLAMRSRRRVNYISAPTKTASSKAGWCSSRSTKPSTPCTSDSTDSWKTIQACVETWPRRPAPGGRGARPDRPRARPDHVRRPRHVEP